ncbi:MucR family transcriptional regulator [Telmatospirillum sp.]|uniref:MucR family transcriptional regulator n=1 Tax=Telmatospirillum sp. TaxID=2079197 RepID=UPI0028464D36|nr:MucR family transcriptional regulator [Telmatospirillum sp.]MDR3436107.1 MucR family transcriptional regulator [Telmatospirillum sp.]
MAESNEIELAADIISAYVRKNAVRPADLPGLIADVHGALVRVSAGSDPVVVEAQKPAVPIKKSVFPDFIICLEDGKKFKSLKRHLGTDHDMTPEQYREKWRLASDYPMVAPNYAAQRSALAKSMGLGQQRKGKAAAVAGKLSKAARKPARAVKAVEEPASE